MKNLSFLFRAFVFQKRVAFLKISLLAIVLPLLASLSVDEDDLSAIDKTLISSKNSNSLMCSIDEITTIVWSRSDCQDNGTDDHTDDFVTIDVVVHFNSNPIPLTGELELTGPKIIGSWTVSVGSLIGLDSYTFDDVAFRSEEVRDDIEVTATFTDEPSCTLTNNNAGYWWPPGPVTSASFRVGILPQCSVCPCNPVCVTDYPGCWPEEDPANINDPCNDYKNYGPDPDFPEHTPIRYIRVVLHFLQREDPLNPGQVHPTDPGNYNVQDHMGIIESWFTDPDGTNAQWSTGLCADPEITPVMTDARLRVVSTYTEGYDIFFHPDNQAGNAGLGTMINRYITTNPQVNGDPEILNAHHIFIDADRPGNTCGGGETNLGQYCDGINSNGNNALVSPASLIFGSHKIFLTQGDPNQVCGDDYPGSDAALGQSILGEIYHLMGVDHNSPLQAHFDHFDHANSGDGCYDTPLGLNGQTLTGCQYDTRCALSQCQIGRMHRFLERNSPGFERFLVGYDPNGDPIFSSTQKNCNLTDADIIVPSGADVLWAGPRSLRSNVIVESDAKLTITCDLGMPEGASITVRPGGQLFVDGAKIYNNCPTTFWEGIVVEGDFTLGNSPSTQGYCNLYGATIENASIGVNCTRKLTSGSAWGGIVQATGSVFLNCERMAVQISGAPKGSPPGYATGEANSFNDCQFTRNGSYMGAAYAFEAMARLTNVRGVRFIRCAFFNTFPDNSMRERGHGIIAQNGGFSLQGFNAPGNIVRSNVSGFRRGIHAVNAKSTAIKVTNSAFSDNHYGIYANNCNNLMVLKNEFEVGSDMGIQFSPAFGQAAFVGVSLFRSRGFKIEENNFKRYNGLGTESPVGVQVYASGRYYNEIYKNTFKDLKVANLANDGNRGDDPDIGLQYLCNESLGNNDYDIAVESSNPLTIPGSIGANQGSAATSAGNIFTNSPPFSDSHIQNEMEEIEYFYTTGEKPDNISPFPFVSTTLSNNANTCPSQLPDDFDGEISNSEKQQYEWDFNNSTVAGEKAHAANMLVHFFLTDSVGYDLDSARYWLTEKGWLEDHFQIVDTYLGEGDGNGAQVALDNIPTIFVLVGEELTEYEYFDSLKSVQIGAINAGWTDSQMVAQNKDLLIRMADSTRYWISGEARALLNSGGVEMYPPEVYLPESTDPQGYKKPSDNRSGNLLEPTGYSIMAIPNPTKGLTEFRFLLPKEENTGKVVIASANGKLVEELSVTGNKGILKWDSNDFESGVYFYSLLIGGKKIGTKRLVVIN